MARWEGYSTLRWLGLRAAVLRLRVMELMVMRLGRGRVLLFMERGWRRGEDMVVVWDEEILAALLMRLNTLSEDFVRTVDRFV